MWEEKICGNCGMLMERKFFIGGAPPIWRCKTCEYAKKPPFKYDGKVTGGKDDGEER